MTVVSPFVDLPGSDALIKMVLTDGRAHTVRVIEVSGYQLTVAGTALAAGVGPPKPGDTVTLRWAGRRGRCAAPCVVRSIHPVHFATWTVEASGTVEIEQRRRFARSPAHGAVRLGPGGADEEPEEGSDAAAGDGSDAAQAGLVLLGELVDIGEGGIRCRLAAGGLDPGQPVFIRLLLEDKLVTLTGSVLRLVQDQPDGAVEAVVTFDADDSQARAIRRYVLNRQRLERAVRPDATD